MWKHTLIQTKQALSSKSQSFDHNMCTHTHLHNTSMIKLCLHVHTLVCVCVFACTSTIIIPLASLPNRVFSVLIVTANLHAIAVCQPSRTQIHSWIIIHTQTHSNKSHNHICCAFRLWMTDCVWWLIAEHMCAIATTHIYEYVYAPSKFALIQ